MERDTMDLFVNGQWKYNKEMEMTLNITIFDTTFWLTQNDKNVNALINEDSFFIVTQILHAYDECIRS